MSLLLELLLFPFGHLPGALGGPDGLPGGGGRGNAVRVTSRPPIGNSKRRASLLLQASQRHGSIQIFWSVQNNHHSNIATQTICELGYKEHGIPLVMCDEALH